MVIVVWNTTIGLREAMSSNDDSDDDEGDDDAREMCSDQGNKPALLFGKEGEEETPKTEGANSKRCRENGAGGSAEMPKSTGKVSEKVDFCAAELLQIEFLGCVLPRMHKKWRM